MRLACELHDDTIQSVIARKQRVQLAEVSVKDQTSEQTPGELETLAERPYAEGFDILRITGKFQING